MFSLIFLIILVFNSKIYCSSSSSSISSYNNNYLNCSVEYYHGNINCYGGIISESLRINFLNHLSENTKREINAISFRNSNLYKIEINWTYNLMSTEKNWRQLNFGFNRLINLEVGVFDSLDNLQKLYLNNNRLKFLTNGIFDQNRKLENLDLCFNALSSLESEIFNNQRELISLEICNNKLVSLPVTIFNKLNKLTEINLSYNRITIFESEIFSRNLELRTINLSNNPITRLNSGIFNQLPLRELYLNNCSLIQIEPNLFTGVTRLNTLFLYDNLLSFIHENQFYDMRNSLKYLILKRNQLEILPNNLLTQLTNLMLLDLSVNRLRVMPLFGRMHELRMLDLNRNRIKTIELHQISNFYKLKYLNIGYNQLQTLKFEVLQNLDNITRIDSIGNPWHCNFWNQMNVIRKNHTDDNNYRNNLFKFGKKPICFDEEYCNNKIEICDLIAKLYVQTILLSDTENEIYYSDRDVRNWLRKYPIEN